MNLLNNFLQKLLALIIGIFIWSLASTRTSDISEVQLSVPITYNQNRNIEIVSDPLLYTNITVEVSKQNKKEIHPSLFKAVINLEEMEIGKHVYTITAKDIETPPNTKIIRIFPNQIQLDLETIVEKELNISPILVGETAKDYVIQEVQVFPKTLEVSGPSSVLNSLEVIQTESIDIQNLKSDIDMLIQLKLPKKVQIMNEKEGEIYSVKILVGSEPMNSRIDNIPIGLVNQNYVTRINPKYFNVLLRGPKSILETYTKNDIQAVIDLGDYKPGTYKIKSPKLYLPPTIQIQKVWPPIDIWVLNQKVYE